MQKPSDIDREDLARRMEQVRVDSELEAIARDRKHGNWVRYCARHPNFPKCAAYLARHPIIARTIELNPWLAKR